MCRVHVYDGGGGFMWRWDQGRMAYFQYDVLRAIPLFAINNDLRNTPGDIIRAATGFDFPPIHNTPWRNYARVFKLCLIASEAGDQAIPTDVAILLAQPGTITCDEYLHFLAEATTDPSPALSDWNSLGSIRHPLCFALKYILAKTAVLGEHQTTINEIIGAYMQSGFNGDENDISFIGLIQNKGNYINAAGQLSVDRLRQSRESIKFLCQISYLHSTGNKVIVTLNQEDAATIFQEIIPVQGPRRADGNEEIRRVTALFQGGSVHDFFDYQATTSPMN